MKLESYKDLSVWQRSMELVKEVYKITASLPTSEIYGLSSQMQRAAVSIPSNIAEGYKRRNRGEYLQFLGVADASAAELDTQILIINDIYGGVSTKSAQAKLLEVQKMLYVLIKKLTKP